MITASIDDIRAVTENVFASLTEFSVVPTAADDIHRAGHRYVTAAVSITGEWEGTVAVACTDELARLVTAAFFGVEPADADDGEINDAIGEVANMIGGNVKALMPAPSQLSLPTVTTGIDYVVTFPGTREESREAFLVEGHPFFVSVLRKAN
jgi:chemotaxis protein CheX